MESDKEQVTFETWNNVANMYQDKFMEMDLYNATYDYFCSLISKENVTILDIGCGSGNISKYLLSKHNYNLLGIDYAPSMQKRIIRKQNFRFWIHEI